MRKNQFSNTWVRSITIFLLMILVVACSHSISPDRSANSTSTSTPQCQAIRDGITYLKTQYNPDVGLIREAPNVAPNTYWLTNDNALAAFALAQLGEKEFSNTLTDSTIQYGESTNGLIEILWSKTVKYPPHVSRPVLVKKIGEDEIWQEDHSMGNNFEDWREYTNLALLGVLNNEYKGNHSSALDIYTKALERYDGIGFKDKAYIFEYETYKLALALYVGHVISQPPPKSDQILDTLLKLQNSDGGFFTHYNSEGIPRGDTNTETTAFTLLALNAVGCGN